MNSNKGPGHFETNRRSFLKGAGAAGVTTMLFPRLAGASPNPDGKVLVVINLRGAADLWGSMCPPVADPNYQLERGSLAIPAPAAGNQTVWIPSSQHGNQRFGLAEAALGLKPALDASDMVLVSGVGMPNVGRSHFEAMREVEFGSQVIPAGAAGWGGGMINVSSPTATAPVRGLAHQALLPAVLLNGDQVQAVRDPAAMTFPGEFSTAYPTGVTGATTGGTTSSAGFTSTYRLGLELLFTGTGPLHAAGTQAIAAFDYLDAINYSALPSYYPQSPFAQALHNTAVISGSPSPRPQVVALDYYPGGWDHHENQGSNDPMGIFWTMCQDLCGSIGAFYTEMQASSTEYLLMVYSEFGRRLRTNPDAGTDHGHGNAMILLGDAVARGGHGGEIFAEFPTLGPQSGLTGTSPTLTGDEDLVVTVDYRDPLYEYMFHSLCMSSTEISTVFHGWTSSRTTPLNLLG